MVSKGDGKAAAIYADSLVWDAHSGFGPSPEVDLSKLAIWKDAGVGYLSIDVGYDVMDWRDTIKSLAYFRRWIMASAACRSAWPSARVNSAWTIRPLRFSIRVWPMKQSMAPVPGDFR